MSKFKNWADLEGQPISFDVNSTTEEALKATDHPSRIHLTTDGRVVMNGTILGDRNPQRGKWDGRVTINKAVPCYARAGMAYYFGDGIAKFKIKKEQLEECANSYGDKSFGSCYGYSVHENESSQILKRDFDWGKLMLPTGSELYAIGKNRDLGVTLMCKYQISALIVVILKDGNIFESGKFKIISISNYDSLHLQLRSPYHIFSDGRIFYTKRINWGDYTNQFSNSGKGKLKWYYYHRERVCKRVYDENGHPHGEVLSARKTVLKKLNNVSSSNKVRIMLQPKLRDRRGRLSIANHGMMLCECSFYSDGKPTGGDGGYRVLITPLRPAVTNKKRNYLC